MSVVDVDELVDKLVRKGQAVRFGNDLTVGPSEDKNNPVAKIIPPDKLYPRKQERWDGVPPLTGDQKIPKQFQSNEACGLKDAKGTKCKQLLVIHRIMNQKWLPDTHGFGGQIDYIEDDIRYYKQCPVHGPNPPAPDSW